MATAADVVVAEAEEIVPVGALDPNTIHTPGVYVDYLVEAHTTLEELGSSASVDASAQRADATRLRIARSSPTSSAPATGSCCTARTGCSAWGPPRRAAARWTTR
jgi:acyl CoA:acetate/3-ketoacid CoA transferase